MKITYLICFIVISSLCLEISALSITDLLEYVRNILDLFWDTTRSIVVKDVIKATGGTINDGTHSCGVLRNNTVTDRIVGGVTATPYEFPWIVSIQLLIKNKYYHTCGGSVIHEKFVLLAAHCIYKTDIKKVSVAAGKFNLHITEEHEQRRSVIKVFSKMSRNFKDDISLLKLNQSLELDPRYIYPACLPTEDDRFKETAILAGWGRLKEEGELPTELQKVFLPLLDLENCTANYKKKKLGAFMHDCQICTLSEDQKDGCQGDSGGPLMCVVKSDNSLRICGIVSWGEGCARKGNPGVYTKVLCYVKWIFETINANLP